MDVDTVTFTVTVTVKKLWECSELRGYTNVVLTLDTCVVTLLSIYTSSFLPLPQVDIMLDLGISSE